MEDLIKVPVSINMQMSNRARLAREGETPTHRFTMDFGEPRSPSLFENIEACRPLFGKLNQKSRWLLKSYFRRFAAKIEPSLAIGVNMYCFGIPLSNGH